MKNTHGDIVNAVTESGARTFMAIYTAWGEIKSEYNTDSSNPNPIGYAGEFQDSESGMIYLRGRYYDPEIGRFITEDPAKDGWNWYAYCGNNPVMFVDPTGFSYDEVIDVLESIYSAKNIMNHTTPGSSAYDNAYNQAMQQKEIIRNSDIYIENWSGLTNLLDEIVNGDNNSLEKIQTTKDKVIAAKSEWESTNFRDDLIFVAVVGGTALIVVRTEAAILSGGSVLKYPGNGPNTPPGKGWEWRGGGLPSEGKGSWYNPNTVESLHPDLNHPPPICPH